jgi:uncharacterized protein YgiM (DUF1202 family)
MGSNRRAGDLAFQIVRIVGATGGRGGGAAIAWAAVGDYREALEQRRAPDETTSTQDATSTPATGTADGTNGVTEVPTERTYVRVLASELNFRNGPGTDTDIIKKLGTDDTLIFLDEIPGWYEVQDSTGATGWVAAGAPYTELVEP